MKTYTKLQKNRKKTELIHYISADSATKLRVTKFNVQKTNGSDSSVDLVVCGTYTNLSPLSHLSRWFRPHDDARSLTERTSQVKRKRIVGELTTDCIVPVVHISSAIIMALDKVYIAAMSVSFAGTVFLCIALSTPYWLQNRSGRTISDKFENGGLWSMCFRNWDPKNDANNRPYDGCFYVFEKDLEYIRHIIAPGMKIFKYS